MAKKTKVDEVVELLSAIATRQGDGKLSLPDDFCLKLTIKRKKLNRTEHEAIVHESTNQLLFWSLPDENHGRIIKGKVWSGKINGRKYENLYLTSQWGAKDDGTGSLNRFVNIIKDYETRSHKQFLTDKVAQSLTTPDGASGAKDPNICDMYNLIVFGAPGTGKSRYLDDLRHPKEKLDGDGDDVDSDEKGSRFEEYERVTFYPTYSYAQFVGSYKPVMKDVNEKGFAPEEGEQTRKAIAYEFVPGPFLRILKKAIRNPDNKYLLIIEEINRANAAAVFGDVFQLLDRKSVGDAAGKKGDSEYSITASTDIYEYLTSKDSSGDGISKDKAKELRIPANMYIWATMNSADQGVFPLDTAFKRRWEFKYMPLDGNNKCNKKARVEAGDYLIKWEDLRKAINELLKRCRVNEDKLLSYWFVSSDDSDIICAERFEMKVLMYLWEDAARMCRQNVFSDDVKVLSDLIKAWTNARFDDVEELDPEAKKTKRGVLRAGLNLGDTKFDFSEKEKPAEDKGQEAGAEPPPPPPEQLAEAPTEAPAAEAPAAEAHAAEGNAGEEEKKAQPAEETDKGPKNGEDPQTKD